MPIDTTLPRRISRTGNGDMVETIFPQRSFRLLYVRCRFFLIPGQAAPTLPTFSDLTMRLDSGAGDEYDVELYSVRQRGYGRDVNLMFELQDINDPSPWLFEVDDAIVLSWSNVDKIGWGLQVGAA